MPSVIDYPRHVRAFATKSRANLKISRVSARDMRASVRFELIRTVAIVSYSMHIISFVVNRLDLLEMMHQQLYFLL